MAAKQADVNPYASPKASAAEPRLRPRPEKLFRWRLIPTLLLYLYGIGGLVVAIEMIGIPVWLMVFEADRFADIVTHPLACFLFFGGLLVGSVVATTAGCLLIVAARLCWRAQKGDWPRAARLAALGFGLCLVCGLLVPLALS